MAKIAQQINDRTSPDSLDGTEASVWNTQSIKHFTPKTSMHEPNPTYSLTEEDAYHLKRLNEFVARDFPFPESRFRGRGIVIPAGGEIYLSCAWVCIKMLRHLGCTLPIEVWHLGAEELDGEMRSLLKSLEANTVDGRSLLAAHPVRILNGWELKAYALLHSTFSEVLLLDADNVPVVDPTFLFDTAQYGRSGAIFWPDYGRLSPTRPIWRITGVEFRDEPEFESGQIVINKARCWTALNVAMYLNEHSDFYYQHIHGDKETFHFAWRKLEQEYAMVPYQIESLLGTMCQHDFDGRRIFQHRNFAKWDLAQENIEISGFQFQAECIGFLEELRTSHGWRAASSKRWNPKIRKPVENAAAMELTMVRYDYHRVGFDRRPMSFNRNGRVAEGAANCEFYWDVRLRDGRVQLEVHSERERTFCLHKQPDGVWRGRWDAFEQMPIELTPIGLLEYGD
jgi:hypothetical protein